MQRFWFRAVRKYGARGARAPDDFAVGEAQSEEAARAELDRKLRQIGLECGRRIAQPAIVPTGPGAADGDALTPTPRS